MTNRFTQTVRYILISTVLASLSSCSTLPPIQWTHTKENASFLRGVFHVHSHFSHDSSGTINEIIRTAKELDLDFIIITDHNSLDAKPVAEETNQPNNPLLIVGNEISTTDGHLISLGTDYLVKTPVEPQAAIDLIHEHQGFAVIAHPICERTAWKDWGVDHYDGIEIYNYACDFYSSNKFSFFFKSLFLMPNLFVGQTVREPKGALKKWDSLLNNRMIPAFAAADAHEQLGFGSIHLIRYDLSFRAATLYIPKVPLNDSDVLSKLFSGDSFIVFESSGRPERFTFSAHSVNSEYRMGESIRTESPVTLNVDLDRIAEIRLIKDGQTVYEKIAHNLTFVSTAPGIYRTEIYLNGRLWIVSNPIIIHELN